MRHLTHHCFRVAFLALMFISTSQANIVSSFPEKQDDITEVAEVRWDKIEGAKTYILEIYQDEAGKQLVMSREIDKPNYFWRKAPKGDFFFRIAYLDQTGAKSPFSKMAKLIIEEYKEENQKIKLIYPKNKYVSPTERQGFEWEKYDYAENYKIIIKAYKKEDIILEQETKSPSLLIPLAKGLYNWKIVAYDENGEEIGRSDEMALKIVDPTKRGGSPNNPYNKNFIKISSIGGNINSKAKLDNSGSSVVSNDNIPMFPNSYALSLGQNIIQDRFLTGQIAYKNGTTPSTNFSEFNIGGSWNMYTKTTPNFVVHWGPGFKYSSLSILSDTSSKNIGVSLNYLALTLQSTIMGSLKNYENWKHILQIQGGYGLLSTKSTSTEFSYELRRTNLWFLKNWPYFYEKIFMQLGVNNNSNNLKSGENQLYFEEWQFPISAGLFHEW